jgi:hypothetical protein
VAIALSGGGIRSVTFSLGILRALSSLKLLHKVDYLSTVSVGRLCRRMLLRGTIMAVKTSRFWLAMMLGLLCASQASASTLSAQLKRVTQQIRVAPAKVLTPAMAPVVAATAPVVPVAEPVAGKNYVVGLNAADQRIVAAQVQALPGMLNRSTVTSQNIARQQAANGTEVQLAAYAFVGQPLTRDAQGRYVGTIQLGVANIQQNAARQLSAPITFQVLEAGLASPNQVRVSEISPPYQSIRVAGMAAPMGLTVHVVSQLDPKPPGMAVTIPVAPSLDVSVGRTAIDAFGLEETPVMVTANGIDAPAGKVVQLSANPVGYITDSYVKLDDSGMGRTSVRSGAPGNVKIRASGLQMSAEADVDFNFPTLTLLASLIGGAVGGAIRLLSMIGQRSLVKWALGLGLSLLLGVLIFALYAVGVNVTPLKLTVTVGQIAVFVVSAVGAYFGTRLLDGLAGGSSSN